MNSPSKEEQRIKGEEAEHKFKNWLDKHRIPYFYIKQDIDFFPTFFKDLSPGKRPDFMILIPNLGLIFVDVKNKEFNSEFKNYPIDGEETRIYSSLQRKFNLHVWYVISNDRFDYKTWLWIPVSKVMELELTERISSRSGSPFFPIPSENFIQIADDDSLGRLFSKCFIEEK